MGEEAERNGSTILKAWWRLSQVRTTIGDLIKSKLRSMVGKGNCTFFWNDLWMGDRLLSESYPRLF